MSRKFPQEAALSALLLTALLAGCKVDDRYSPGNIKGVDTEVSLFEEGITVPLVQSTAQITVDEILKESGVKSGRFGEHLTLQADGSYTFGYKKQFSLKKAVGDLGLGTVVNISPVTCTWSSGCTFSRLNASSLKTEPLSYSREEEIGYTAFSLGGFDPVTRTTVILEKETVQSAAAAAARLHLSDAALPAVEMAVAGQDAVIKGMHLSEDIESVDEINMKEGSQIRVEVSLPGAIFTSGEITPEVKVDLGDVLTFAGGASILDCSQMVLSPSNGFAAERTFAVSQLNAAKITEDRTAAVSGRIVADGLKATVADAGAITSDIAVQIKISFENFEVESVFGNLKETTFSLDEEGEILSFDLPGEVKNFGTFTIIPKGSPVLEVSLTLPEIDGVEIERGDDAQIRIPEFLRLKDIPSDFTYDEEGGILHINNLRTADYRLAIDRIVISPKEVGGKYIAEGRYAAKCAVGPSTERMDLLRLNGLSGQKFAIRCNLPAMEAESVILDELTVDVDEKASFDIIKASDIPDMVKSVGEIVLDEVSADIRLTLTDLTDLGGGRIYADLTAQMPDFVVPSEIELKGEIVDGKFSRSVKIEKLDFSKFDLGKLRREGGSIGAEAAVKGCLRAENPSVDLGELSRTVESEIAVKIAGQEGDIKIRDIAARLSCGIDSTFTLDIPKFPEALNGSWYDFPDAQLTAKVTSNLGIPMSAEVDINSGMYNLEMGFPCSADPSRTESVENRYSIDLNPLLQYCKAEIPVGLHLTVSDGEESHICPDASYNMYISLDLGLDIDPGEECKVTYSDTLELSESATAVAGLLAKSAVDLFGTVESTLPLEVGVKAELLKCENGVFSTIETVQPIETIIARPGSTDDFSVEIKAAPGADTGKLSHIRFSFTVGSDGSGLNGGDYILIKGLGVKAPEGITL